MFSLYKIHQLGSFVPNSTDQYLFYDLPMNSIIRNDMAYAIDTLSCKKHNSLHICPTYSILNTTSYLQSRSIECQHRISTCPFMCTYELLPQGILFRDNMVNQPYSIEEIGIIKPYIHYVRNICQYKYSTEPGAASDRVTIAETSSE